MFSVSVVLFFHFEKENMIRIDIKTFFCNCEAMKNENANVCVTFSKRNTSSRDDVGLFLSWTDYDRTC